MSSQLVGHPSFRDAAINAVAIVPLTIPTRSDDTAPVHNASNETTQTHSEKSFYRLFSSLKDFASSSRSARQQSLSSTDNNNNVWAEESSQVTLILPHSQLTRPGDWRYETTPLKSHDWRSGCQRMHVFDGRPDFSRMAYDRLHHETDEDGPAGYDDPWKDLELSRGTAVVIGILNMKDCLDTSDLWRAEENLISWARQYSHPSDRENIVIGAGDDRNILVRLFVFDSFDEGIQSRVNLNATRFQSSQLVAFPPLEGSSQMIALHWNVVVNDLAVALFRNTERRIKMNDAAGKSAWKVERKQQTDLTSSIHSDDGSITEASTAGMSTQDGSMDDNPRVGVGGRLKNAFDNTRKAIANRQESGGKVSDGSSSSHNIGAAKLVTPLDLDANTTVTFSSRDMEALKRRDAGRREKRSADLSLLAGSPIDAYERYTRAAELTRHSHDPLWYASALEGCACAFIAMADIGGHGVDEYLESNFQLPEEVMALAIAQGVASGADLDVKGKTMTVDRTKTTMPQAVTALVEEALSVLCRHEKLAPLHAGLLLKLAAYVREDEEGHLRCRWGEGEFCFGGESSSASMTGEKALPRWERTSVGKLNLQGTEVRDMLVLDSIERGRKFTELLHRAVSVGGLDNNSRCDVAVECARSCLVGTKETQWGDCSNVESRLRFPRKAAFFTIIAAEAMSNCESFGTRTSNLYLAASQLYSQQGNELFEDGGNKMTRYGWATLRSETLVGLASSSQSSDMILAEAAIELLMALLGDIAPDQFLVGQQEKVDSVGGVVDQYTLEQESKSFTDESHLIPSSAPKIKQVSKPLASMTTKTPFFSQAPPSALSLSQSKWLDDDPIPHVQLPFVNSSVCAKQNSDKTFSERAQALNYSINAMKSVRSKMPFSLCARIQRLCIEHLRDIRNQMPSSSNEKNRESGLNNADNILLPPLVVTSAKIVKADSHLVVERTKALGYSAKFATHSMSTFFNPYAKNKADKDKNKPTCTLIAEGEERAIMVEFKNRLTVPLEVPSCVLEFDGEGSHRIEAPPLSFTVPAQTKSFAVHFPFIIPSVAALEPVLTDKETNPVESGDISDVNLLCVSGLRVTCLNRTFPVRFGKGDRGDTIDSAKQSAQLPPEMSRYLRSKHTQPPQDEQQMVVQLESVPAQPNLLVSFANSQSPLEDDVHLPVHLSEGEIYSIPSFRLENDFGRSGLGEIERLQVLAVGLPGIPDETLFDTDALAAKLEEEEDVLTESDDEQEEDFEEMMECDGLPPLKMKVIAEGLDLRSINDKTRNKGEGSIVTFQIAATHDMGDQLANGGNVRIRFRYRGPSSNPATEIWRKREISLRIIKVKGPRISSLTFRSDLSWGSSYSELCKSLSIQKKRLDKTSKWESSNSKHRTLSRSSSKSDICSEFLESLDGFGEYSILHRLGKDSGVHVSSDEVVLLVAVANETNSTIILSNRKGLVGGFEGSPMPTVRVTSGVSVKIPVVIPRIDRLDENGEVTDIAAELVARTALQWESEVVEGPDETDKIRRTGRVRIPSRCLREIIDEHKSFPSRICKPPVTVNVGINNNTEKDISVLIGLPIHMVADVCVQDWVPRDVLSKCRVVLEFCCAEKQPGNNSVSTNGRTPFVWCGQLRRTIRLENTSEAGDNNHCARIAFFQCGVFVVSACAKIASQDSAENEECWWAPYAITIRVEEKRQ